MNAGFLFSKEEEGSEGVQAFLLDRREEFLDEGLEEKKEQKRQSFLQILGRELMDTFTVNLQHWYRYTVGVTLYTPIMCINICTDR